MTMVSCHATTDEDRGGILVIIINTLGRLPHSWGVELMSIVDDAEDDEDDENENDRDGVDDDDDVIMATDPAVSQGDKDGDGDNG